jgi:cytochrome o ubiquinol oxidase subunit 3
MDKERLTSHASGSAHEAEVEKADTHALGFWIYLMSDIIIFGVLFAVYFVLRPNTFGGPSTDQLFSLPNALAETLLLLTSSFTCGLALLASQKGKANQVIGWLVATFVLGGSFLWLELSEFGRFIAMNAGPSRSAFLSSFFTLVSTHGLHISVGLLWIVVAIIQIRLRGLTPSVQSKLGRFVLFWHFLDIVWIFIFTTVYLMGII